MIASDLWLSVDRLLDLALEEDVGPGDATTEALVPAEAKAAGAFVSRSSGILAGMEVVERLFERMNSDVKVTRLAGEGERIHAGQPVARIEGSARTILTGERLALNLLQRMSGVATATRAYVDAIAGTKARVFDTRKTMPGMRALDKLAVYIGGGLNHRRGLYDMILIKDNHLLLAGPELALGSVASAVTTARKKSSLPIMVEVDSLNQLREAVEVEPDLILLDNMDPQMLTEAVQLTARLSVDRKLRRPVLEASGNVTLSTIRAIAESGVDRISVGSITHSVKALDIGLDLDPR